MTARSNPIADKQPLARQGRRLMQIGVLMLLFTSLEGFVIPAVAVPQLGLSAHKLGGLEGALLLAFGLMWPRLDLGRTAATIAYGLFIYSNLSILAAYVLAAAWGAGAETMTQAAAGAHGSPIEEAAIKIIAYSSAPTGLAAFLLTLWGLRGLPDERQPN